MRAVIRIAGPILVCLLLVEGSIHTHDSREEHESSGDQGCFLCTFLNGAETGPPPAAVEPVPSNPDEVAVVPQAAGTVSLEPLTVAGNRSPPA